MTGNLQAARRLLIAWALEPIGRLLSKTSVTPNLLTLIAFLLSLAASMLVIWGALIWAGILLLLSGFFDLLDGALARAKNMATKFGAVLDSTLDRFSEAAIFLAIIFWALSLPSQGIWIMLSGAGMAASFFISYIKARAESLGVECNVGIFTRAERIIFLSLGLILNQILLALALIFALSLFTIWQRLYHVWKSSKI